MASGDVTQSEVLEALRQGGDAWNEWRERNLGDDVINLERQDLSGLNLFGANLKYVRLRSANIQHAQLGEADLSHAVLADANLSESNLGGATLHHADLFKAKFHSAKLYEAKLNHATARRANFYRADLTNADLSDVDLSGTSLQGAQLTGALLIGARLAKAVLSDARLEKANLTGADLSCAQLVGADCSNADITNCRIYGISAWDVVLVNTRQVNLIVTPEGQPEITVDDMEIAQLLYLLLNNQKIRNIVDAVTSKVVLILGRFVPETKPTLAALKDAIRGCGYCPVIFDFEKPHSRDFVETVCAVAHLSRFVVADFTQARIVLEEVPHIVRSVAVPIVPLLRKDDGF